MKKIRLLYILLLLLLSLVGCQAQNQADKSPASAYTRTYTDNDLSLMVTVSAKTITVAEKIELHLDVEMPEDFSVSFPELPEGENRLKETRHIISSPELTGNGRVKEGRTSFLEPFLAGNYQIPALKITFRHAKETAIRTIITEPIDIIVTSLLAPDDTNPEIADILPVVDQPLGLSFYLWTLAIVVIASLLLFLIWRDWDRRRKLPPPPIPPHVTALAELDRLVAAGFLAKGEIKLFHQGVSDILRRYIENRFGLKAPERTTEEFLVELGHTDSLPVDKKHLLHEFLTQCDLVKFAEHRPGEDESAGAADLCRRFIRETKQEAAP